MSQEIVTLPPPTLTPMALLQNAISQGIDPDKLGKLMELVEQWNRDRAAEQFANAITAFQRECPMIGKKRDAKDKEKNVMYSYAAFEDIWRVAQPILARHAISVTFDTCPAEAMLSVTCKVRVGIHVEASSLVLPIPPATARCNATQAFASAVSYGKRYALTAALGIVTTGDDNDAQGVVQPLTEEQVIQLEELITDRLLATGKKANAQKFAEIFGGTSLETIPANRFGDACAALKNDIDQAGKAKVTR